MDHVNDILDGNDATNEAKSEISSAINSALKSNENSTVINTDDGGTNTGNQQHPPKGYLRTFWNQISNYNFGNNVTAGWNRIADNPLTLGTDALDAVNNVFLTTRDMLFTFDFWKATYNNVANYIKASPEDKARIDAAFFNSSLTSFATFAPLGQVSGLAKGAATSTLSLGLNGGYGYSFEVGNTQIRLIHGNQSTLGSTIFSIKQLKPGGNLLRFDYGMLHRSATEELVFHSTFRFNIGTSTFGSTAQYPLYAPFIFWNYKKK